MYTRSERIITGIALLIALGGVINLFILKTSLFGIPERKLAILLFVPLGIVFYFLTRKPR